MMIQKWRGEYFYGDTYSERKRNLSIPFKLECSNDDGIIKGTCVDEESKELFEQPASISGFIDDGIISFIKLYPHFWYEDKEGNISLYPDLPSDEIHYSGIWTGDHFEGDWEMVVAYTDEQGNAEQYACTGNWTMFPG